MISRFDLRTLEDHQLAAYDSGLEVLQRLAAELEYPTLISNIKGLRCLVQRESIARVEEAIEAWRRDRTSFVLRHPHPGPVDDALSRAIASKVKVSRGR